MKEASIFLYQLMHQHFDEKLKSLLEGNEQLSHLRESKYYNSKALTRPHEIDQIHPIKKFNLEIGFPIKVDIEAGKVFTYNAYVPP